MKQIYKLAYRIYRLGTLSVHWSRRRFTLAGLCVAGAFVMTATLGTDIDNTVTYQTFVLLLGLLVPAIIFSWFFYGKFSIQRSLPRFGSVGQPLRYRVTIKNLTARVQNDLTLMDNLIDPRPKFDEWLEFQKGISRRYPSFRMSRRQNQRHPFQLANVKEAAISSLPPRGENETQVELTPLRRGVLRFTGATIARTDPLGLYRSFVHVTNVQTILILPKRYPLPPIALPGFLKYQEGGMAMASNVGRSDEFVSLRDYRRGDPVRHIHWRSWAKAGKPIVKEFEDQFFVRHALVLDTFTDDLRSQILEEAISVAASFACTVLTQESLLDLLFIGAESYCFTAGRGLGDADQILEILASVQSSRGRPFQMLENLVFKHATAVSGCICIFLEWNDARQNFIKKLRALNVPLMVFVVIEFGDKKPDAGVMRDEPENFHVLELGKVEQTLARLNS